MKIACVIPLFNHAATVENVALRCRKHLADVYIMDDGSTDLAPDFAARMKAAGIELVRDPRNRGKGAVLRDALTLLRQKKFDYAIAIDADGQHDPAELPKFIAAIEKHGRKRDALFVGCRDFTAENVPGASKFGRKFSNFWVKMETGVKCADTQSGFRAYPVAALQPLHYLTSRYNFEIEILVRGLWSGLLLREIPVSVKYDPPGVRISHFRKGRDNFLLSCLHAHLVALRLCRLNHPRTSLKPRNR